MRRNDKPEKHFLHRNTLIYSKNSHLVNSHPLLKGIILIVAMAAFIVGAYGFRVYSQANHAMGNSYKALPGPTSQKITQGKPVTFLLLGVDTGGEGRHDRGNSDTMIVVTVNPQTKKSVLMSVPRDTLAQIYGAKGNRKIIQKVNSAYNLGESPAAVKTVDKLLNINIDYYITMDFHSLPKIVDSVGGVEVNSPLQFSYDGSNFKKGKQKINGKESLAYARMRYQDPKGDYGRQLRQRQVIMSVVQKALSLNTLMNLQKVLDGVSGSMETNLTFNDMTSLVEGYRNAANTMESDHLQGHDATIDGLAYEIAPTKELQRVSDKLRKSIGESTEPVNNEETRQNLLNTRSRQFDFNNKVNQQYKINGDNVRSNHEVDNHSSTNLSHVPGLNVND